MILVQLLGGLGNQMFQYALARSLAKFRNIEFRLDISAFETYKLHKYALQNFNVTENIATERELELFKTKISDKQLINSFIQKCKPYYKKKIVNEKYNFKFDKNILKVPETSYLRGYWQNENYFNDIKEIIYKEFTVKYPQVGRDLEYANTIKNQNSVSMHFRRGDYISDQATNTVHGTCNIDYYKNSVKYIAENLKDPSFFVFSDDIEWVKNNFKIDFPAYFIEHNDANKNYEDLRLMSQCKNNIIANSSFSWWGAWLNQNPQKIVISPKKWLNHTEKTSMEHIPLDWIKI